MDSPAATTSTSPIEIAEAFAGEAAERVEEIEDGGRLPRDLMERVLDSGILRVAVPPELGGLAMPPAEWMELVIRCAAGDGSLGWLVGATISFNGVMAAKADPGFCAEFFADRCAHLAGGVAGGGTAVAVADGFEVEGSWDFSTGAWDATWLGGLCVERPGEGEPRAWFVMVPADRAEVRANWDVVGLRGTASETVVLPRQTVPARWAMPLGRSSDRSAVPMGRSSDRSAVPMGRSSDRSAVPMGRSSDRSAVPLGRSSDRSAVPLGRSSDRSAVPMGRSSDRARSGQAVDSYGIAFWPTAVAAAATQLGIARRALAELAAFAAAKHRPGSRGPLDGEQAFQRAYGRSEAAWLTARSALEHELVRLWDRACEDPSVDAETRRRVRLAATHAALVGADVVRACFDLAGATAMWRRHPLARCHRDGTILSHHTAANERTFELLGRVSLGLVPDDPLL